MIPTSTRSYTDQSHSGSHPKSAIGLEGRAVVLVLIAHVNGREDVVVDAVSGQEGSGRRGTGVGNIDANQDQVM